MSERYYLDSAIWLDHFEDRNELNLSKGDWAHNVLNKIARNVGFPPFFEWWFACKPQSDMWKSEHAQKPLYC